MKTTALLAGLLLASAGLAHAQEPTTVVEGSPYVERVPYQPSALASQDGIRDLRNRIRGAVRRVCDSGLDSVPADYNERRCNHATLTDAFAQVDRAVESAQRGGLASVARIVVAAR